MSKLKRCRTVSELIKELEKLPKTAELSEPIRPVHYNVSATAKAMHLKPCVGFEEASSQRIDLTLNK